MAAIGWVTLTTPRCVMCNQTSEIEMPAEAYHRFRAGAHIQNAWPDSTPDQRELVLTGTHPKCWDALAPDDDDEDEAD